MYMLQITLWRDRSLSLLTVRSDYAAWLSWTSKCGCHLHPFIKPSPCIATTVNSIPVLEFLQFVFLALLVHLYAREVRLKQAHLNLDQSNSLLILKGSVHLCQIPAMQFFIVLNTI